MKIFMILTYISILLPYKDTLCSPVKNDVDTKLIVLENEIMEPIILDCDYEITDINSFLIVKWFKDEKTLYQWIRGSPPSSIPLFKNDVDSAYETSIDPNKQFSSLALKNPTIKTTGDYKCIAQTKSETYTVQKRVQIIDVRNHTLSLNHYKIQNETQLECMVANVFPKPSLTITSDDDMIVKILAKEPVENDEGYYNATIVAAVYDNDEALDSYRCVVTFEGYSNNLTTVATSESNEQPYNTKIILVSLLFLFMISNI